MDRCARRRLWSFAVSALIAIALLAPGPAPARAGGVVGDGTLASCTEAALNAALAGGGTVTFNCGPGPYAIPITSQKSITLNTTIDGGNKITLDGQNLTRLFDVGAVLTLRNIVLTRGFFNGDGGAIRNNSNGTLILESSTIRDSRATASGGAILSTGPLTITNSLLHGNTALNGGALYPRFPGARTMIIASELRNNSATDATNGWGGAILAWDGAPVTLDATVVHDNSAREGGGIYHFGNATLTLVEGTWLYNNQASNSGGGIYVESGSAALLDVTLSTNGSQSLAGGMFNHGTAFLNQVTVTGNTADGGAGLYNSGTLTLTNAVVNANLADFSGGGLTNASLARLTDVTVSDNTAADNAAGVYNIGTLTATNVTFSGNVATDHGGGLYNDLGGLATVTNATFSNNQAGMNGGGLVNVAVGSVMVLDQVTLSGNSAGGSGGGLYQSIGPVRAFATLVANSPSGLNCSGTTLNDGFNLASDTSCGASFTTVANLVLGPLANNGGPTWTHMPLTGSPARDVVTLGCPPPATDQRGYPRNVGPCDAGAVEAGATLALHLPDLRK